MTNNIISKVAQIFADFMGHFENSTFKAEFVVAVFGQLLVEIWLLFSLTSGRTALSHSLLFSFSF